MYKCYRLENNSELESLISGYEDYGKSIMEKKKASIHKKIDEYLRADGLIDFSNIQEDMFPLVDADIFISHSHIAIQVINALAGWLNYKFGVNVFVDSYIWGYCNDLLREIDEEYCKQSNGELFDYNKRNISTAHVHMMLANSLNKMIDKTECIIFIETNNSLNIKDNIDIGTSSAWIYSELVTTSIIARRIPDRLLLNKEIREQFNIDKQLKPFYRVERGHLTKLDASDLHDISLMKLNDKNKYLDILYDTVGVSRVLNE